MADIDVRPDGSTEDLGHDDEVASLRAELKRVKDENARLAQARVAPRRRSRRSAQSDSAGQQPGLW